MCLLGSAEHGLCNKTGFKQLGLPLLAARRVLQGLQIGHASKPAVGPSAVVRSLASKQY